jgi:hypothetical protein
MALTFVIEQAQMGTYSIMESALLEGHIALGQFNGLDDAMRLTSIIVAIAAVTMAIVAVMPGCQVGGSAIQIGGILVAGCGDTTHDIGYFRPNYWDVAYQK